MLLTNRFYERSKNHMARKESITVTQILETAFSMTREEGFSQVTARKVAARAGCSTQPIFRTYKNMDELCENVYEKASFFFRDFYSAFAKTSQVPFVNLGMAYIAFAREEKHLFELLFLNKVKNGKSMYELLNQDKGNVVYEITKAKNNGCDDPQALFMRLWVLIHGAACMSLTGDYDLSEEETRIMLEQSYDAFYSQHQRRK